MTFPGFIAIAREVAPHSEYRRRIAKVIQHPPTPEQIEEYEAAKAAYEVLVSYSGFWSDDHGLEEPHGPTEVIYAETEEEWQDRVAKLPKFITIPTIFNSQANHD